MELKKQVASNKLVLKYQFSLFTNLLFKANQHHNTTFYFWNRYIIVYFFFIYHHMNCQYKCFVDMFSSDFLEKKYRFSSVYNVLSYRYNHRIFLSTIVDESMIIDSTTSIYPNIMWYERESWDFYGILYSKNNDLRRILNDYGFKGFPLRKDFPLSGFLEVKYDYLKKSIAYEPVKLVQEFRYFDTKVPWKFYH